MAEKKGKKGSGVRMSLEQAQKIPALNEALQKLGLIKDGTTTPEKPAKKKRAGVEVRPIVNSLASAAVRCHWDADSLTLWLDGGRVLTLNEMISVLQTRRYEVYRYKKACRAVISRCIKSGTGDGARPYFDGPCRLTLVRIGQGLIDRDSLEMAFKYLIDSLRSEGIIADDNANIIVDIDARQATGACALGLRLDRLPDWVDPGLPDWAG